MKILCQVVLLLTVMSAASSALAETVLLVVPNASSLGSQDQAKRTLIESWGYTVTPISANESQANFDAAVSVSDVVYISEEISSGDLGTKLKSATIGVVNDEPYLADEFGFSTSLNESISDNSFDVLTTAHYITQPFSTGDLVITTSNANLSSITGTIGSGVETLGDNAGSSEIMLAVLERDAALEGGGTAAGRRVQLPWGGGSFDINLLNDDGKTLMRRAIEWASHPPGLLAYWDFDEGTGATAADQVGGYDVTISGASWTTGKVNGALSFDGDNDQAVTAISFPPPDVGTIVLWMKTPGPQSDRGRTFGVHDGFEFRHETTGVLHFDICKTSTNDTFVTSTTLDGVDRWYHVAAVFDSDNNEWEVYIDGALDNSGTLTLSQAPTNNLTFGRRTGSSDYWEGVIDEFRIYDRKLTLSEIQELRDGQALFTDVTASRGFDVSTTTDKVSGLHWGDLDGDGDLDAVITGSTSRVLLNDNAGSSFFSTTLSSQVRRQGALLDIDNDGDLDFWAVNRGGWDTERLFENNGSGTLSDSGDRDFDDPSNNEGVAAADVNGDGLIDVVMFSENGNWIGLNNGDDPLTISGSNDSGDGLNDSGDYGNGDFVSSADVNNDGYPDFFYHYGVGKLFLSDGDGTYTHNNNGISVVTGNDDKMGSAWADYDNDGDLDLFVARYDNNQRGYLWRNDSGTFTDVTVAAGVDNDDQQRGVTWGDYDNDGFLDLYIATTNSGNVLYHNEGDGTFTLASEGAGVTGTLDDAVFVDYDNDGDLDLAMTRRNDDAVLLENQTNDSNYLLVHVVGAGLGGTNLAGIGTRVMLYESDGSTLVGRRDVGGGRGYGGQEPLRLHFGGVDPAATYVLRAHFLSGTKEMTIVPQNVSSTFGSNIVDQMVTIEEDPTENLKLIQWMEVDPVN